MLLSNSPKRSLSVHWLGSWEAPLHKGEGGQIEDGIAFGRVFDEIRIRIARSR